MNPPVAHAARTVQVNDVAVAVQEFGEGEPQPIVNGTFQLLGSWTGTALA